MIHNRKDKYDTPAPTVEDLIRYEKDYEALVAYKVEVVLHDYFQWWPDGHVMHYNNRAWGWRPGYHTCPFCCGSWRLLSEPGCGAGPVGIQNTSHLRRHRATYR